MTLVCAPVQVLEMDERVDLFEVSLGSYKILYDKTGQKKYIDKDWMSLEIGDIVSYHHYEETPDLEHILSMMKKKHPGAHLYKVATFAKSILDSLRMLQLQKRGVIGVCMGPLGSITRICAPIFGAPIAYAPLRKEDINASGQLLVEELNGIYHFDRLNSKSLIFALIGNPVDHSIGHIFHNAYFRKHQLNGVYVKLPLHPFELSDFFSLIRDLPFKGLSVTAPLKEAVIPFLDDIDEKARAIGAVNTIAMSDGRLLGYNTDADAARCVVEELIGNLEGKTIAILGAGGVAKAIIWALILSKAHVVIVNRTISRGKTLASLHGCFFSPHLPNDYDLLINATSVQMPVDPRSIRCQSCIMDLAIYDTDFLKAAKAKGCKCQNGLALYYKQAFQQQEIWKATAFMSSDVGC